MFNQLQKFGSFTSSPELGSLLHFVYDAKGKDTLLWWDRFPLAIAADNATGGFLGYNLHYAPVKIRKYILDELTKNSNKKMKLDRMRANYRFLKSMSIYDDVKPCIKHYLIEYIKSRFLIIDQQYYSRVVIMPTAKWAKGTPPGVKQGETDVQSHQIEKDFIKNWGKK